jgi:hypothetical protein
VSHNARVVDRQLIEEPNDTFRVTSNRDVPPRRAVAPSIAKEVHDHDSMPLGNQRDYIGPEVRRRWKSM